MTLPRRSLPRILAIIALLLPALYVAGLIVDWPAWLHGSNWVWLRRVPEVGWRFLWLAAALAVGLALAAVAGRGGAWPRRRTALFLGALVLLAPLVQIAVAAQHRAQPLDVAVLSAAGFWHEGARISDPLAFAREHAAHMPSYSDIHVRTQPPGWPLAYWAAGRAFERAPGLAEALGRRIHRFDCLAPELMGLDVARLAAGSLRLVVVFVSGLGVLPLYAIGRRFFPSPAARLAVVGYAYLPGLLVFSGRFDVAYALLALAALWLALRAVLDGRRGAGVVLALLLAGASFFTFTALAIAGLAWIVAATCALAAWGRRDGRLWRLVWLGGGLGAAVLLFWGGLRLLGVDGLAMWRTGQAIHREYRLNYPAWFLYNLYDLAVFMGFVPFVGAIGALLRGAGWHPASDSSNSTRGAGWHPTSDSSNSTRGAGWHPASDSSNSTRGAGWYPASDSSSSTRGAGWYPASAPGEVEERGIPSRATPAGLAWGWAAAVLLLNLSATVRAETGRLWLFLMPLGLLVGLAYFALTLRRRTVLALFTAFLVQALAMGFFLGGRAPDPATPPPLWRVPDGATPLDYRLGDEIALRGYDLTATTDGAQLTLFWQALDFPRVEYSAFVHARRDGAVVGQSDGPPAAVPMWCWVPGEVVADERVLIAPGGFDAIGVGLYDPVSGVRRPVAPPAPNDAILLPAAR